MNENNRNAFIGMNVETLFKNSIVDNAEVTRAIQEHFKLDGHFTQAIKSGIQGEKADVKMEFACGHNIDVNIKAYKEKSAFNQLTRTSVSKFCNIFDLSSLEQENLENIVVEKSINPKNKLFAEQDWEKWEVFFNNNVKEILKWGFSSKPTREILVLFNRDDNTFRIYPMLQVLKLLNKDITHTKGGFNIGDCVSFQRKGGNGSLSKIIPKNSIKHPGNNIQLKLKCNKFVSSMEFAKIAGYKV
jgi:hypothetical protein